jgi:hypothetical protein
LAIAHICSAHLKKKMNSANGKVILVEILAAWRLPLPANMFAFNYARLPVDVFFFYFDVD